MMVNRFRELPKVLQMMSADLIDDVPVDRLIAVDSDIPESNRFCQTLSQDRIDDLKFLENLEVFGHRAGRGCFSFSNEMRRNIDRNLDCALEIQRYDVLYVSVTNQLIHGRGSFPCNPLDTTAERFQLGFY